MKDISSITRRARKIGVHLDFYDEASGIAFCGEEEFDYGYATVDAIVAGLDAADRYEPPAMYFDDGDPKGALKIMRRDAFVRATRFEAYQP